MYINVGGTWRAVADFFVNVAGTWRSVADGFINVAGTWRSFFTSQITPVIQTKVTIAKSSSNQYNDYHNPTFPVTLTGTRFHWTNANPGTFTYQFFRSADGINYTGIGTPVSTSNPSSGLSATNTYQLTTADFPSATMYFKFRFTATNTTYNTTAISESDPITVTYLDIPAPPSGFPRITQSTIGAFSSGQSGTWIGSPTSYTWNWYFDDGLGLQVLTYEATKSITNKAISGTTATLTSSGHGFKSSDLVVISGVDALFNATPNIYSVTANAFSYTISKPAWSFTTNYSVNDYVTNSGSIYKAIAATPTPRAAYSAAAAYSANVNYVNYNSQLYYATQSVSSVSAWNSSVSYSLGTIVAYGDFRWVSELSPNQGQTPSTSSSYWSQINTNPSNSSYWTLVNIYPNSASYWQLQNFSTSTTGTAVGPNYYEGTQSTPVTYNINPFPSSDYKTGQLLKNNTTVLSVSATNGIYTGNASSTVRTIYGFPSIALQNPTFPSATTASMSYTQSDTSVYDIDVKVGPAYTTSVSGYPKTSQPNSSPISITGLSSGTTYTAYVTPKNADTPRVSGIEQTKTFTTPSPPGAFSISSSTKGFPSGSFRNVTASWSASSGASTYNYQIEGSNDNITWFSTAGTGESPPPYTYGNTSTTSTSFSVSATLYRYYRVSVRAQNVAGATESSNNNFATTGTNPGDPTIGTVTTGSGNVSISFTRTSTQGSNTVTPSGSNLAGIQYRVDSGSWSSTYSGSSPLVVTLSPGTYTINLRTINDDALTSAGNASTGSFTISTQPDAFSYTISNISSVTAPNTPVQTRVSSTSNDILIEFASSKPADTENYTLNVTGAVNVTGNKTINLINLFTNNADWQETLTTSANNSPVNTFVTANGLYRTLRANVSTTTGASSWAINYTISGADASAGVNGTYTLNTSSMPVTITNIIGTNNPTVTINSVTAYSGANQTGGSRSGTAGATTSLSNIAKPTATSGTTTNNWTYFTATASGFATSDITTIPSAASGISVTGSSTNVATINWTNGSPITSVRVVTSGAGSSLDYTDGASPFDTSRTTSYTSSGTINVTITTFNNNPIVRFSWNQSNAQSYSISRTISGSTSSVTGNASGSSASHDFSAASVTINSLTVYTGANQTGFSTTYSVNTTGTASAKSSIGTGSGSVTYTPPPVAPNNGSVTVALQSGTAGRVGAVYSVTSATASGNPTPTVSGYQWQYYNLATDTWISISGATSSTYTISYGSSTYSDIGRTIRCAVTFTNGVSPNLVTGSNNISVSNATITGVTATLSLSAPFIIYRVYGYNFQSIGSKNSYGTTTPPTNTDANYTISATSNSTIPITRQSSNGGDLNYYRLEVGAYGLLSGAGAFSGYITTNIIRNNATNRTNSPVNIYGTGSA